MPSPVGHALGGMLFGWLVDRQPRQASATRSPLERGSVADGLRHVLRLLTQPATVGFALLGALADVDFAFGAHSAQTHSLGAAAAVFLVASVWRGRLDLRLGAACAMAYASHVLFDWMGSDTTPPIGIMALWPLTDAYYQSELYVFDAISRRYWLPNFWAHNMLAVAREIVVLGPLVALAAWLRLRPAVTSLRGTAAAAHRPTSPEEARERGL